MTIAQDKFDCFRRHYIGEMLIETADAMPPRKRAAFRKFIRSLKSGEVSA